MELIFLIKLSQSNFFNIVDIATSFSTTTSEDANHYSKMVENSSFVTTKRQRKTVHFQVNFVGLIFSGFGTN